MSRSRTTVATDKWVVCASGPSIAKVDLSTIPPDWRIMVINNTWQLAPHADVLYAGDEQWWDRYHDECTFAGERWTRSLSAAIKYGIRHIRSREGEGLCLSPRTVHTGGNSGYQALNLAYHFGARRIIMLGYDMHRRDGGHWHGDHTHKDGTLMLSAPNGHINAWRRNFRWLAKDFALEGVRVVNCTEGSALECFQRGNLEHELRRET